MKRAALALLLIATPAMAEPKDPPIGDLLAYYDANPEARSEIETRALITAHALDWYNGVLETRDGKGLYCITDSIGTGEQVMWLLSRSYLELPDMKGMTMAPAILAMMRQKFPCKTP